MNDQKAAELKTWGIVLGALKAAKEEGNLSGVVCSVLGMYADPGVGERGTLSLQVPEYRKDGPWRLGRA